MSREKLPDVLEIWGITWTKRGRVWEGPPVGGPDDAMLQLAVSCERIVVRDGRYVMVNPRLTLDRFGWEDGDLTIHEPDDER